MKLFITDIDDTLSVGEVVADEMGRLVPFPGGPVRADAWSY